MIPLRLVVDTNIVVSAALKADGLQRTVLLLAISKPARLYVSNAILAEYRDVLSRPELQIRKGLRRQFLDLIRRRAHLVDPVRTVRVAKDHDDDKFIGMRRRSPCRLPGNRKPAGLSEVLEEYQDRHVSRVSKPSGAASYRRVGG